MSRLFKRHDKRKVFSLDGFWKFKTDISKKGIDEKWYQNFPNDCEDMVVPSCWNNELGLYDYEGLAWYMTTFSTVSKNICISFGAVTGQAEVYLDGVRLGEHYGGFTGFDFLVKDLVPGVHALVVAVDNTHDNMNTIPLSKVDWFHYGGIYRSVEIAELGAAWIKNYHIDYKLDAYLNNVSLSINLCLESFIPGVATKKLNIYIDGKSYYCENLDVLGESSVNITSIELKNIQLWDIGKPNLYNISFEIEDDDITERMGFRQIKVENRKLLLNGREIFVKGVNRHEDHPDWGFAVPLKLMKKDIDIIRNLGCNAIRGSHYPNSEVFLDYLDQQGLLFWEEIPMWGYPEEPLKNSIILERGLKMHEEMVTRDYHHPCIIIWSMHNEIDTRTQAAYDITKAFTEKVRSLDQTRPLSFASMFPLEDICFPLVDIISVNKYFGWYYDEIKTWDIFLKQLNEKQKNEGLENRPIIISEFGAAALYGDSTLEGPKWTENYQEKLLKYTLNLFYDYPGVVGTYIWQYCDMRTAKELELGRARSFNNKGILNEYRKPKLSYWTVQKIYNKIK